MMLSYPLFDEPLQLKEGVVNVLVMENAIALRNIISAVVYGGAEFVLSKDFKIVEFSKYAEFIYDVFNLNCNSKTLLSKMASESEIIAKDYWEESAELITKINEYGNLILSGLDFPAKFSYIEDAAKLIKFLNVEFNDDGLNFGESLLEYMNLCRRFLKKEVFVFLNLKSFFTNEELVQFYKSIEYERLRVLLLESHDSEFRCECEKITIIDKDLCII